MMVRCGNGFLDGLKIFGAGVKKEMDVGVDQAGEKGGVAEIDDFGAGGVGDFCADFGDGVAIDRFRRAW